MNQRDLENSMVIGDYYDEEPPEEDEDEAYEKAKAEEL